MFFETFAIVVVAGHVRPTTCHCFSLPIREEGGPSPLTDHDNSYAAWIQQTEGRNDGTIFRRGSASPPVAGWLPQTPRSP
jgi:hypothetical protein